MTELETLERAKMYMEKLANGINPFDDSLLPAGDFVNHVRLSRCFFYVADVLRRVIENGGVPAQKRPKTVPFFLPAERLRAFAFSSSPIPITELTKRINALIDNPDMMTMSYHVIRDWLTSLGMMKEALTGNGKVTRHPTARGESLGILLESRAGMNGPYFVVVYNLAAQHFILDNLNAIVEFERAVKDNKGQVWTPEQDSRLRELHGRGAAVGEMAVELKRNAGAIRARLQKLGLIP